MSNRGGVEGAVHHGAEGSGRVAFRVDFHDDGKPVGIGQSAKLGCAVRAFAAEAGNDGLLDAGLDGCGHGEKLGLRFADGFEIGLVASAGGVGCGHAKGGVSKGGLF